MNVFCLVGKIDELPVMKQTTNGVKTCSVLLQVERPFANSEGVYESDRIAVEVWRGLAETLCSTGALGDLLAIKGRIVSRKYEKEARVYYNYSFIAEKIDFLKT